MASKEQSVTLLRKNKRAQVEALNSLGFHLDESARAADFPMYQQWGSGLLDVCAAANRKSDNKKFFFSIAEWQSLSASEQDRFLLRGVRVRAFGTSFIIAPDTINNKEWGTSLNTPDLHYFPGTNHLYSYLDAYEETTLIAQYFEGVTGTVNGAPAAEVALAYKAFSEARDGMDDTSQWCLPTMAHLMIMWRCIDEIDEAFTVLWSADFKLQRTKHWSCCKYDNNNIFRFSFNTGSAWVESPTTTGSVRPICID
jgi:hypothetical protein